MDYIKIYVTELKNAIAVWKEIYHCITTLYAYKNYDTWTHFLTVIIILEALLNTTTGCFTFYYVK
jgi:hypothetical protein